MSTMLPTEEDVRIKVNMNERAHVISSRNQQECRAIAAGITARPTSKSDTARERRKTLVEV